MRILGVHGRLAIALISLALAAAPVPADDGPLHRVKQVPPVIMGTSGGSSLHICPEACYGATLGSLVLYDGVLSILSNNHVLARNGAAVEGEPDIQPGLMDVNCAAEEATVVGNFAGDKVPLGTANVDAAIATANANVDATGNIMDIGVPCSEIQAPVVGLNVIKSGRTTGLTYGAIQATDFTLGLAYQPTGCLVPPDKKKKVIKAEFTGQVVIVAAAPSTIFSTGGDSGSLIVSNDGTPNPTALLFAASDTVTVGNPIQDVVSAFQAGGHTFTFVGNTCGETVSSGYEPAFPGPGRRPSDSDLDSARAVKARHEADLLARPGVLGVGVGAADDNSAEAAVIVYVNVPEGSHPRGFPSDLDGVRLRVIPSGPIVPL